MAESINDDWLSEDIPPDARLYMRVHWKHWDYDANVPLPAAFSFRGARAAIEGSWSTNWEKYSDAADTRRRSQYPHLNAVISFGVDDLRAVFRFRVEHSPDRVGAPDLATPWVKPNRAHTDVWSKKRPDLADLDEQMVEGGHYRLEIRFHDREGLE